MASATSRPGSGAGGRHAEGRGLGLVIFASILLFVACFFNMLYGIAVIADSHFFTANAHYVVWAACAPGAGSPSSSRSCNWPPGPG